MHPIQNADMPVPRGHYSHCLEHQGILYLAGQLPLDPDTRILPTGIEAQTEQTLANLDRVLRAAGSSRQRVLSVRIYVADIEQWDTINRIYAQFFGDHRPARTIVPCGKLHFDALLEIEAIAAAAESSSPPTLSPS